MKGFDHFPKSEQTVPIRRHISAPDGSDVLEFGITSGDGEIDGVKFDVVGTHSANIEFRFKNPKDPDGFGFRYIVKARDIVAPAYELYKQDLEAK